MQVITNVTFQEYVETALVPVYVGMVCKSRLIPAWSLWRFRGSTYWISLPAGRSVRSLFKFDISLRARMVTSWDSAHTG